jgi:hypothetical protein
LLLMRALVTGFNARTASPMRATRDTCFAALLAAALSDVGYAVEHRSTSVIEDVSTYDQVFVGMASPLAVSSNRAYAALATIGRTWSTGRLVLFLDDPDVGKILNGLDSLIRKPEQFTNPFLSQRVDYAVACEPEWQSWLLLIARALREQSWPTLLVPAFSWADVPKLLTRLPSTMTANAVPMDLSTYMPAQKLPDDVEHERFWVTEEPFDSTWVRGLGLTMPVKHLTAMRDSLRADAYAHAWGVLEAPLSRAGHGWFSPRLIHALRSGAVYATDWQAMSEVGTMFTVFPHVIEQMSVEDRAVHLREQQAGFNSIKWTRDDSRRFLHDLTATKVAL